MRLVEQGFGEAPRRAGGDAGRLQRLHRRIGRTLPGPLGDRNFQLVFPGTATRRGGQGGIVGQVRSSDDATERPPGSVVDDRDDHPGVVALAGKAAVRDEAGVAVAEPGRDTPGHRLLDHPGRGQREQALDLRQVDVLALPGRAADAAGPVSSAGQAESPPIRVAIGDMVHGRRFVRPAGQPGQARGVLERGAIGAHVGPGRRRPEGRHRHHHNVRPRGAEGLVVEAEARHPAPPGRSSPPPRRPWRPGAAAGPRPRGWSGRG